jgi:glycosyltransferase involved in cell wall biosynthesis
MDINTKTKVILLSQVPLPFSGIGSWTTIYENYLRGMHLFDYIVCETPKQRFDEVDYSIVSRTWSTKLRKKWNKNPYLGYLEALDEILKPNQKFIIQIVDNFGIIKPLLKFLEKKGLRRNCYLQFFYHGFSPFYENFEGRCFFETIDEMVLLTYDSYLAHKNYYTVLPTRFSVLNNGIDTATFFLPSQKERKILKQDKNVLDKKVFIWCSQDRPKKGLHLLLNAWKSVFKTRQDIVLWVIGCEPKTPQAGVEYLGRIPNKELAAYFQASDCYLFPTLCHEGFGMSLIEALHCGNYCIASAIGGVPEVLQYGKLGKLIENPHFVSAWEEAILEFLDTPLVFEPISPNLYSTECWNKGMNNLIENTKFNVLQ